MEMISCRVTRRRMVTFHPFKIIASDDDVQPQPPLWHSNLDTSAYTTTWKNKVKKENTTTLFSLLRHLTVQLFYFILFYSSPLLHSLTCKEVLALYDFTLTAAAQSLATIITRVESINTNERHQHNLRT